MQGEATSPTGALRVALVGPLVSVMAAATFGILALALDGAGAPALVEGLAGWLASVNLLLAAFNLVPAAPLDGGRVLQAVLWRRNGDRLSASATAAKAGRGFGYVLIGLGVLDLLTGVGVGGLWFVLLGWFLAAASQTEQAGAEARAHLGGVRVAEIMTPRPAVVPGWITVGALVNDYVGRHRLSAFPVQDFDGGLAGVVTLKALKQVPRHERATLRVKDVAVPVEEVPVARSDDRVLDLVERMSPHPELAALVVDDGQIVGMVSPTDIAQALEVGALRHGGPSDGHRPQSLSNS